MKMWRVFALVAAIAGFLLVECEGGKDRTRAEIVRNYLRQNQHFGESLESYSLPTSRDLFWSHTMDASQAGALAGALGLEWPPPLRDDGGPGGTSTARAYCSWNWRYCLLALTGYGSLGGQQTRFCLMDTMGHVGWGRDLVPGQRPAVSDLGTAALFTMTDSLITTFVNPEGKILGRWACPRAELITAREGISDVGVFAFMPDSERFIMLMNPRKKAPYFVDTARQYIRCLRTDGSVEWQYDLGESSAKELAFPGNGRVIAFGSQEGDRLPQAESRSYVNAFYLFDADGDLLSHIERSWTEEIERFCLLAREPSYLYFLSDKVEILDLQSGKMLTQVPLRPLYDALSKSRTHGGLNAERLIRRQLGLGVRDTIPPLE